MTPEDRKNGSCGNIMYKILGVYVCIGTPLPVANLLTADNNDARKPPTISYMWALTPNPEKTFGSGQGVYKKQKISLIG